MGWAKQELETIDLGDPRLNRCAVLLAERLGQKPGASIPGACENWAVTVAAYRFLRNERVSYEDVDLIGMANSTWQRRRYAQVNLETFSISTHGLTPT